MRHVPWCIAFIAASCAPEPTSAPPAAETEHTASVDDVAPAPEPEPIRVPAAEQLPPASPSPAPPAWENTTPPSPPAEAAPAEAFESLDEGMTLDEAQRLVGVAATTVASDEGGNVIYRWSTDKQTFLGRFRNGVLEKKTLLSAEQEEETAPQQLDRTVYDQVTAGMSVEEVLAVTGIPGRQIVEKGESVAVYRWSDANGSSFTARFEDGKLVRKTGFVVAPLPPAADAVNEPGAEGARENLEGELLSEGDVEDAEIEVQVKEEEPTEVAETEATAEEVPTQADSPASQPAESVRNPRVRVLGAERRAREAADSEDPNIDRSYKPRAKLPDFTWSLPRGVYEVRITNPTGEDVEVGIRSGKHGKDIRVGAGDANSVKVGQGAYSFHYIYEDQPYTLFNGGNVRIDGAYTADVEIRLENEDYDVRHLDYSGDVGRR